VTKILALDPGTTKTAYVIYNRNGSLDKFGIESNESIRDVMVSFSGNIGALTVAIEKIESYGMAVGAEVFTTVFWAGRFAEYWYSACGDNNDAIMIPRRAVKLALCHSARAKDANVRQAIIDMYGGKDAAIGKKKTPGKLYGVSKDVWAALGVAITTSLQLKINS